MAVKKFVSLENLTEYDGLIKGEIKTGDDATLESANSYTDSKVSNITSGTIVVKEAEHADSSDEATHAGSADHAESADSATKATQDGDGKVITSTYETKTDASAKLTEAKTYTDSSVDELAANVAYIDDEDNENVVDDNPAANIIVDSALSTTSTNPVQNKVITNKIDQLSNEIDDISDDSTIKDEGIILSKTYLASTDGKVTTAMGNAYTVYFPCKPSKKYKIRKINTKVFRIASTSAIPVIGMSVSNYVDAGETDNYEYMTSDDAKYIVICYYIESTQEIPNKDNVYASLKIGVTAKDDIAREGLNAVKERFDNIPYQNVSNIKNIEMSDNVANPNEYLAYNTIYKNNAFGYATFDGYRGTGKIDVSNVSEIYTNGNQYAFFTETSFVSGGNCSEYVKTVGGLAFYRVAVPQDAKYVGINFSNDFICYVTFTIPYVLNPYGKVLDFTLDEDYERIFAKYFKSERTLEGKSFSILGDSFSTYFGWLPTNYDSWYANNGIDGENTQNNSLNDVTQTWWYKLMSENGMKLLINDSFSGATICTTSWGGNDTVNSFVGRSKLLCEDNALKEKPDFIFILGGLNDTWGNSPIGTVKYNDITEEDLKNTLPALSFIIAKLKKWNPQAKIVNMKLSSLPTDLLNGMDSICSHYGIDNILLDWNKISKENNHPTASGMMSIKEMIVDYFSK